jgi:hypothetical protein
LIYYGGNAPVLTAPKIYLVLWGFGTPLNDPNGEIPYVTATLTGFPGWHWQGIDTQYYQIIGGIQTSIANSTGQFISTIVDNTRPLPVDAPPPTGPNLAAWRTAVGNEAVEVSRGVDQSANALYVVATPPRSNQQEQLNGACAWHGSIEIPETGTLLPYADLAYQPSGSYCYVPYTLTSNLTSVTLHETMEAITDPIWDRGAPAWSGDTCGAEIGDFCGNYTNEKILPDFSTPNLISLPKLQSKAANSGGGGCVESYTNDSYRFYIDSSSGNPGYLYSSLGGNGCPTSGSWWDGVVLTGNVASVSWAPKRIDLFMRDTNGHLQHMWTNDGGASIYGGDDWGTGPSGWTIFGNPAAASWGPNHLDVFALAKSGSSYALVHRMWNQNSDYTVTFTGWENWGSPSDSMGYSGITTGVSAVSEEPNRVDAFVIADPVSAIPNLWMASRSGSSGSPTWVNWGNSSGYQIYGTPSAASWGPGRWDVFVHDSGVGAGPPHLRQWYYDASCCTGWYDWGAPPNGMSGADPSAIAMGENRLNIYLQGSDKNIYRRTWDFADLGWSTSLGCSNPANSLFTLNGTR